MSTIPTWNDGFARSADESEAPEQWVGLVGAWAPCLGIQGGTLYDVSGYANHGALANIPLATAWVPSTRGSYALDFAGTDDYVVLGTALAAKPTTAMTITALVYVKSVSHLGTILGRWGDADAEWVFAILNDTFFFDVWAGSDIDIFSPASTLAINTWYHLAATYRASSFVRIFLNGRQVGEDTASVPSTLRNVVLGTTIGRRSDKADWYLNAQVGTVCVYNVDLDAQALRAQAYDPYAMYRLRPNLLGMASSGGALTEVLNVTGTLGALGGLVRQPARTFVGTL